MVEGQDVFEELLSKRAGLNDQVVERLLRFRALVVDENSRQNLTRLTSAEDFYSGHVEDSLELVRSGFLEFPAMDLGTGMGSPGIIAAILGDGEWVLAESEGMKASFLEKAVQELGLQEKVRVFVGRGEDYLRKNRLGVVVAKAVGPVERIIGWIGECSTWNNLVLLKGPNWQEEWQKFSRTSRGKRFKIVREAKYCVGGFEGAEKKERLLVSIGRR